MIIIHLLCTDLFLSHFSAQLLKLFELMIYKLFHQIVWDADKGKWVNQLEGDENVSIDTTRFILELRKNLRKILKY